MILASIVTLAFFKMKQPLIIGYLFAGMLLGPLSPLWASLIPEGSEFMGLEKSGILSDVSVLNIFAEAWCNPAFVCDWNRVPIFKDKINW
ncbi:hypothetical protein QVH35_06240 [Candidatus Nitrosotenuis chungbukensis]|uniref:hypothetical protein n=1 Tax=Candidatus Nitrosotenuis chungbukensis TaxID=1353246 RepID=UPI002673AE96|nr:hypothetical protein [Candidatus Nitrosotenuis chungbukensis]WKT57066.1 hypothetical protein QVH35_06240 [Candidatus Nitrosotenuis chungbukensis]